MPPELPSLRHLAASALALGSFLVVLSSCALVGQGAGQPDHTVAAAFDRRIARMTLRKTDVGGVETLVARDTSDQSQIAQVRAFLEQEEVRFRQGRYEDPAKQHGMEMPNSKELEAGYTKVQVASVDLDGGGQITYAAADRVLVDALHAWFDRRLLAY